MEAIREDGAGDDDGTSPSSRCVLLCAYGSIPGNRANRVRFPVLGPLNNNPLIRNIGSGGGRPTFRAPAPLGLFLFWAVLVGCGPNDDDNCGGGNDCGGCGNCVSPCSAPYSSSHNVDSIVPVIG